MKHAVKTAEAAGSLGLVLNRLFQRTFAVAKDVRTQHRHRQRVDFDGGRIGQARGAHLSVDRRAARAVDRCRRDDRSGGDAFRREKAALDHRRQPHARARRATGGALRRRCDHAERTARAPGRIRHHRHVDGELAADPRQGHARARDQGAPACADVHRRPRRAARRRAGSRQARRRLPVQRGRPRQHRQGQSAGPRRRRARGGDDDRRAGAQLPELARRAHASCR